MDGGREGRKEGGGESYLRMADIFSSLPGTRFPDAGINDGGPLPTQLNRPEGIQGDPDELMNFDKNLTSGLTPCQYGLGTGRNGSNRNHQQISHRKQYFIPKL